MTSQRDSVDPTVVVRAAVDVLVFAPLGLGAQLVDDAPDAVKRARQELSNARFIGRLAVDQGIAQLRTRLSDTQAPESQPDVPAPGPLPEVDTERDRLSAGDLALPDYDTLPAIDIVAKLEMLSATDRAAIASYESKNRQRRTVLGKLAQLGEQ
jgi:hypothetical protein